MFIFLFHERKGCNKSSCRHDMIRYKGLQLFIDYIFSVIQKYQWPYKLKAESYFGYNRHIKGPWTNIVCSLKCPTLFSSFQSLVQREKLHQLQPQLRLQLQLQLQLSPNSLCPFRKQICILIPEEQIGLNPLI